MTAAELEELHTRILLGARALGDAAGWVASMKQTQSRVARKAQYVNALAELRIARAKVETELERERAK